ncbi:MAG: 6-phosphofructokinase [Bradymonadia bacterium]
MSKQIKRVGIIFSGGPAPAANAVISAAAVSFLEEGIEVLGFFHGYSNLAEYHPENYPLLPDKHFRVFDNADMRGLRNERGICIGTARTNPGKGIKHPADLADPSKTAKLKQVYDGLRSLNVDALISIGGDDTLKTANFFYAFQEHLPDDCPEIRVVHLPKTIDNDYSGIDFTFGYFTAVDTMAKELLNLRADAKATSSWFIVETMGRKAGWLPYGVGIAGEANLVLASEDLVDGLTQTETDGSETREVLDLDALAQRIVDLIVTRERRDGKGYGTVVLAEGLGENLPASILEGISKDDHGHITLSNLNLTALVTDAVERLYEQTTGSKKKIRGVQLGYESRCAAPHAFDVMLGSQLGIGAYRALISEGLNGFMVSIRGQLELTYVPFDNLVNPETLVTEVRFISHGSDFHQLARFLETRTEETPRWQLGRRTEPTS